jgi:hypothetical protein
MIHGNASHGTNTQVSPVITTSAPEAPKTVGRARLIALVAAFFAFGACGSIAEAVSSKLPAAGATIAAVMVR